MLVTLANLPEHPQSVPINQLVQVKGTPLADGEAVLLADSKLWHNATPINTVSQEEEGHMDLFVLTARGGKA
mgnify:CR=1 FL=1